MPKPRQAANGRHMRITATLALPDDHLDAADMIAKTRPVMDGLRESLPTALVEHEIVAVRGPRVRKPRAVAPAPAAPSAAA